MEGKQPPKAPTSEAVTGTEGPTAPHMMPQFMQAMKCATGGPCNIPLANLGPRTIRKIKKLIKHEVKHAVDNSCPDKSHLVRQIVKTKLACCIEDACGIYGKQGNVCTKTALDCGDKCPGSCQCGCACGCSCGCNCDPRGCPCYKGCSCEGGDCSVECCQMEANIRNYTRAVCKFMLEHNHDQIKQHLEMALNSFKQLKGCLPPTCGGHGKSFQMAASMLMHKLHEKGMEKREKMEKICRKFWISYCENVEHAVKHKMKRKAQSVMFYLPDKDCDMLAKAVGVKCIQRGLMAAFHAQAVVGCMLAGELPKAEEHKGEEILKEQTCPLGLRRQWKANRKFWRKCLKTQSNHMINDWIRTYGEMCKMCIGPARELVQNMFKECHHHDPIFQTKMVGKIVAHCMFGCYNEKKDKAACEAAVKKYAKGMLCCCDKACIKVCRRRTKVALQLNGIHDETALYIGARWGGMACCKENCKEECPRGTCADFTARWVKENSQTLMDAYNAGKEMINECKELGNNEYLKCRIMTQGVLWYLKFNHQGGKFNRDDFRKFWDTLVSKNRALIDYCRKSLEEHLRKACEGTTMKCEGPEFKVMLMTMLDTATPREMQPYKMIEHRKRFPGMQTHGRQCMTCNLPGMPMTGHMMSPMMMSTMMPGMPMMPGTMMPGMMQGMMMPEMMGMMMMPMMGMQGMPRMEGMREGMMGPGMMPGMMMPGMMSGMMMTPEMMQAGMMPGGMMHGEGMMRPGMMGKEEKHMGEGKMPEMQKKK